MINYTTLTTEQAAKAARAETLKEVIALLRSEIGHGEFSYEAEWALEYYCQKLQKSYDAIS